MARLRIGLLWVLVCSGCAADLRGPHVDLGALAMPTPLPASAVASPVPPAPAQLDMQPVSAGSFRVWVVPLAEARGDTVPGYFRELSLTLPPAERLEPLHPMPRVPAPGAAVKAGPKGATPVPGPGTGTPPPALLPPPSLPAGPAPVTAPVLPAGLVPSGAGVVSPQQLMDLFPKGR